MQLERRKNMKDILGKSQLLFMKIKTRADNNFKKLLAKRKNYSSS